jgi:hypothetical protein
LGHKSDIADGSLRGWEFRSYNNIIGDYYIAPSFMDKVTVSGDGKGGGEGEGVYFVAGCPNHQAGRTAIQHGPHCLDLF